MPLATGRYGRVEAVGPDPYLLLVLAQDGDRDRALDADDLAGLGLPFTHNYSADDSPHPINQAPKHISCNFR